LKDLYKIFLSTSDWDTFFNHANSLTKHEKGELFEKLTELVLLTKPAYKTRYKNVWLLRDGIDSNLKSKLNLPNADEGIDLIAETHFGTYCSIQCKFKGSNESPTRKDIATFLDLSRNHCKNITEQILAHTGTNGIKKTALLPDSFTQIGLDFWSQLNEEDWSAIQLHIKGTKITAVKRKPREHQREAIETSKNHFLKKLNTRGKLLMPCGTGKSLTAFWINQALGSKSTIVAVPSLALIKQSLEDWTKEMLLSNPNELPDWSCICSDESTGQLSDDFVTDTYSLGIPTTTNEKDISEFLTRVSPNGKIIFTTYQSADKLALVSKKLNYKFDLAILDEAHKTVGAKDKAFSILLQEDRISIGKRLFMTATERIVKGADDDILSMDDANTYGEVFYKLSFKKAIEDGIITDYKIVTVFVNDVDTQELINKNKFLKDNDKFLDDTEAQMLTTAIALKKAIKEYNLKHTVSFHKSINASKEFQKLYQQIDNTSSSPKVYHISSKLNAGARANLLKDFKNNDNAVITNARCLTEGVDVPAIDCVLFADQKQSVVDIVQASGRALRQFTDSKTGIKKEVGYIIIPIVLKEGESLEDLTESSRFKTVTRIVTSLSTQDETIAEELKLIDAGKQKIGSGKIQVLGSINKSINLDLNTFSQKISTKIWERIARANWMPFEEAINYVGQLTIDTQNDWRKFSKSGLKPLDLPTNPNAVYERSGWVSWGHWLGTGRKATKDRVYWDYNKAKSFVQNLKLKSEAQWRNYTKTEDMNVNIPVSPSTVYKDLGWKSMGDWLGTGFVAHRLKEFLPFEDAREFAHNLGLKNIRQWNEYCLSNEKPDNIPTNPNVIYRDAGWDGFGNWLGTKNVKAGSINYREFEDARRFVRNLKLTSKDEWEEFCKSGNKPDNIPTVPRLIYKSKGWIGIGDWLGTGRIATNDLVYRDFESAREFVRSLNLKSQKEWYEYCNNGNKPFDIPRNADRTYKNLGWIGFGDWLGSNKVANKNMIFLPYTEAKEYVNNLKLRTQKDWNNYCKENTKPTNIPRNPAGVYKNKGWISWNDWLGK
jgi:superfamily II DNA or RNA helicase